MRQTAPVKKLTAIISWIIAVILLLVPFHAFITVWLSSAVGHYTLLRLWKEFLLVVVLAGAVYILLHDKSLRQKLLSLRLTKLIIIYCALLIVCGFVALFRHTVTTKAMWYGLLVDLRFLVFFLAAAVIAASSGWLSQKWLKLLFVPAVLVAAFAILQYSILPYDFLKHFGYSSSTISPYETINHNLAHIRVASTLRGANTLGAYLVVPICALAVSIFKQKRGWRDKAMLGIGLLLALAFSFSRSAWIGATVGVLVVAWLSLKSERSRKITAWVAAGFLIIASVAGLLLRNNLAFEDAFLHTDRSSSAKVSSNEGHVAAFKSASKDVLHQPLGDGVGTAGPQSVYNNHPRIAENYFLQIGQEAGVIGMLLFIAICFSLGKALFDQKSDPLSLALLAALIGLTFVNLLSHAWEDDTLTYVFWGLAGIALAPAIITDKHKRKNGQKIPKPAA